MDRYEVMAGKMTPLTDGAHRKWGFTGKVETRSYERLVDALIDFVETGDGCGKVFDSERVFNSEKSRQRYLLILF